MGAVISGRAGVLRGAAGVRLEGVTGFASSAAQAASVPWLPLLPLLAIPVVGTSPESLGNVILAMQIIFLLIGLRRPHWVLGAVILSELTIRNYAITFPFALLIVMPHFVRGVDLGPKARPIFTVAALFVALSATVTYALVDVGTTLSYLKSVVPDFFVLLLIPLLIRRRSDIVQLGLVAVIVATASAGIGIAQQFEGARFLSVPHATAIDVDLVDWGTRALGLDLNPILLTDHLMLILFPVLGDVLARGVSGRAGLVLFIFALIMITALSLTQTRSWVFGAAAATTAMALVLRGRVGRELLLLLAIGAFGFLYWTANSETRYSEGPDTDSSAAARPVLWSATLQMALDYPVFGVGFQQFNEYAPQYASAIDPDLLARHEVVNVLNTISPHNDYLNAWASFGTGGLFLYLLLLIFIGANFLSVARSTPDPLLRGLAIGCFGALMAFGVNSFFHNLLTSGLTLWILAGVSLALVKISSPPEAFEPEAR